MITTKQIPWWARMARSPALDWAMLAGLPLFVWGAVHSTDWRAWGFPVAIGGALIARSARRLTPRPLATR